MSSGLTFTHGLILGQLSVLIAIGAFIKFFIFGEAPPKPAPRAAVKSSRNRTTSLGAFVSRSPSQSLRKKPSTSNVLRPVPSNATNIASILRKTYYQIAIRSHGKETHSTHQPESLDWFNVLLAQTIAQYRQTVYNLKDSSPDRPSILQSLSEALNNPSKRPSFIDHIKITEISMGEEFPIFSNVRVIAVEDEAGNATGGRLQALMDVDLSDDNLTMGIETNLILNYPKPLSAILPVGLSVSVVRFSGTLSISFVPATLDAAASESQRTSGSPKTNLAFSFLPDYRLDLSVKSLIGSRSRLQDVPKIAQLVEARVQAWFEERVVEPRVQVVPLPGLWPRMGKTRVREGQEDDRPISSEGSKAATTPRGERRTDTFVQPTVEADHDVQGLRYRPQGFRPRVSSQVLMMEEDDGRLMPGSMSP